MVQSDYWSWLAITSLLFPILSVTPSLLILLGETEGKKKGGGGEEKTKIGELPLQPL